jgi:zinc/manganese transport system substrate-binding protein
MRVRLGPRRILPLCLVALIALPAAATLAGCDSTGTATAANGAVNVVAAENFWGSIAAQLGGTRAAVTSIIVDPARDPHSYEPSSADARTLALAQLAIVNGMGYDRWASNLLAAEPADGRLTLDVGSRLGVSEGDNPHRWYSPADVERIAATITADLTRLDPKDAGYFAARNTAFEQRALAGYHALIATIRLRFAGVPVGASESIFALLAPALGLDLVTPATFMKAISEGTDVSAADTATTQRQIENHEIKVWIYNRQNTTPAVQRLTEMAHSAGIPVASITETLSPASASFERWQVAELHGIEAALHQATGR